MVTPAWVRREVQSLRARREVHEVLAQSTTDAAARVHAQVCGALCRLVSAALMDHAEDGGSHLAMGSLWAQAVPSLTHDLEHERPLTAADASAFVLAVDQQLDDWRSATVLPGPAHVLLPRQARRPDRLSPFEDLARRLRHKGAIDAIQRHLPTFEPRSPLVDALMDEAVEAARRTAVDGLPEGRDRPDRAAILNRAADAVEGLAMARPWLERVDDPYLHPGASILFVRVQSRLHAARALAGLDVLRHGPHVTDAMQALRAEVASAIEAGDVSRAEAVLCAHGPALECVRALVEADDDGLNRLGATVIPVIGRQLPDAATVKQLDRLRRVAGIASDPEAQALVQRAATTGDVDESDLQQAEGLHLDTPASLHVVPSQAVAAVILARRASESH